MDAHTILIIEDHQPTASALQRLLRASKFNTVAVSTIAAARGLLQSQLFDLVITDLHLPDGDIVPHLPELRKRQPRIIAISGSELLEPSEGDKFGFITCLRKPVSFDELHAAILAALQ
jgi:DNA-binding response OmpR family regulator